jgi:NADPH:quinone reductase-like Zn-dependent oxidoreductase
MLDRVPLNQMLAWVRHRQFDSKLAEHAARLAGVLRLAADLGAGEITSDDMEAGIALAEHYAAEALRLFGVARVRVELHLWDEKARELTDRRGVDCVVEIGGPGTIAMSLKALAWADMSAWLVGAYRRRGTGSIPYC